MGKLRAGPGLRAEKTSPHNLFPKGKPRALLTEPLGDIQVQALRGGPRGAPAQLLHTEVYENAEVQLVSTGAGGCLDLEMEVPQRAEPTARAQIRDPKELWLSSLMVGPLTLL